MGAFVSSQCRLRRVVAASTVVATFLVSACAVSAAEAATPPYWTTGQAGASFAPNRGTCKYLNYWRQWDLSTAAPDVYARNNRPGGGNDWQWVRYRTFEVSAGTGNTLRANSWSEWKLAYDTTKASFNGGQKFAGVSANTVLELRVEWWSQTQMLGAAAHRISSYNYYDGYLGPFGPIRSCA